MNTTTSSRPSVAVRPPHPEHQAASILAGHEANLELLDRLSGITLLGEHLDAALADMREVMRSTSVDGRTLPILDHVLGRILDQAPGTPGGQNLEGTITGGGTSDPTGTAALIADDSRRDLDLLANAVQQTTAALDAILATGQTRSAGKRVRDHADTLVRIVTVWQPREADPIAQRDSTLAADGQPGCEAHAQLRQRKGPEKAHWWQPILHRWRGGLLGEPAELCSSCYERAVRTGTKPTGDDVAHFDRVGKWPVVLERKAS